MERLGLARRRGWIDLQRDAAGLRGRRLTFAAAGMTAAAVGAASPASAGDEPFVEGLVLKTDLNIQTGPATVIDAPLTPDSAPWVFDSSIEGIDLAAIGPVTVAGPFAGSPAALGFTAGGGGLDWDAWRFLDGAGSRAALDAAYPDGTYTLAANTTGGPVAFDVDLTGGLFPASTPVVALTGGSWVNGQYHVPVGQAVSADVAGFAISNLPAGATSQAIIMELFDPSEARIQVAEVNSVDHPGASSVGLNFTPTTPGTYELQSFFGVGADEIEDEVLGIDVAAGYAQETVVRFLALSNTGVVGDNNGSGQVEQGDLDLVLQNWGVDTDSQGIPSGWTQGLPQGQIEQTELDGVLQNWGDTVAPDFSRARLPGAPEPATAVLLGLGGLALLRRRA